jgi:hypothetical protein
LRLVLSRHLPRKEYLAVDALLPDMRINQLLAGGRAEKLMAETSRPCQISDQLTIIIFLPSIFLPRSIGVLTAYLTLTS